VPAPALVGPDLLPGYHAQLASAAQAAFVLPSVAIDLNFRGKARISFLLRDGVASAVTVVQSSGLGAVDRAAVKAVQTAKFPTPPSSLSLKDTVYLIWVEAY
jgi:protein TonB